jgi:hypothetical protein
MRPAIASMAAAFGSVPRGTVLFGAVPRKWLPIVDLAYALMEDSSDSVDTCCLTDLQSIGAFWQAPGGAGRVVWAR